MTPKEQETLDRLRRYAVYDAMASDTRFTPAVRDAAAKVARLSRLEDERKDAQERAQAAADRAWNRHREAWRALMEAHDLLEEAQKADDALHGGG